MRALRFHGNKDIRVDEIPEPTCKPGWVKVKNAWSGICGSDLHEYLIGPATASTVPHKITGECMPAVLGHEFAGTVFEVGDGVSDLKHGQKVAVQPFLTCGSCYWCDKGIPSECDNWGYMGYTGYGGGFAEYICVPEKHVFKLPDSMPLDVGALVEPLTVAWHAVKVGKVESGDTALVIGGGPIGLAILHCLQAHGAKTVIVSEPSQLRASHAKEAGADHVLDPTKTDVTDSCRSICEGQGPRVVFDCAGVQASVSTAMNAVRGAGTVVSVAIFEKDVTFNPNVLLRKEVNYIGAKIFSPQEFQEVIEAIASGKIRHPEKMITGKFSLQDAVEKGFRACIERKDANVKVLISPDVARL
ncbi:MAG: hypothetical protein M1827_003434 [Pycnora praestabilis]|nr:MAG: hypothetical protein M1827_003434 [Pycnora praestabilis]